MKQQNCQVWLTDKSRLLIRVQGEVAEVAISLCNPEELEELAEAAVEAAAALRERSLSTTGAE